MSKQTGLGKNKKVNIVQISALFLIFLVLFMAPEANKWTAEAKKLDRKGLRISLKKKTMRHKFIESDAKSGSPLSKKEYTSKVVKAHS